MALKGLKEAVLSFLGIEEPEETGSKTYESVIPSEDLPSVNTLWAYRLALHIVSETLGTLLSKCEIKTYINNNEKRSENYYLFNVSPNANQSAAEFKKEIVRRLVLSPTHDALIVAIDNLGSRKKSFFVADSFTKNTSELYPSWFSNVSLNCNGDGGLILNRTFSGEDAIYIKYNNAELNTIFNGMRNLYQQLAENGRLAGTYRQKYVLEMDAQAENMPNFEENLQNLLDEQFNAFIKGDNAVLPLFAGMKLNQVSAGADLGQNASTANSSVNAQVNEIYAKVGAAFNIPSSIMNGSYEENDIENILTFALDGIAALIEGAFNQYYYGIDSFKKGIYCRFDTSFARHVDFYNLGSVANNAISSGIYTIDEMRAKLHEDPVGGEVGTIHFITRNYAVIGANYLEDPANQIVDGGQQSDVNRMQQQNKNDGAEQKGDEADDSGVQRGKHTGD